MLTTPTLDKLRTLNLTGMARAFAEQMERADYQALSFEDRLGLMVDREAQDRDNRRLDRSSRHRRQLALILAVHALKKQAGDDLVVDDQRGQSPLAGQVLVVSLDHLGHRP